jgi:opacity protein-like surface antigen
MRSRLRPAVLFAVSALVFFSAAPCVAQSFGIGARLAMVKSETDSGIEEDSDSVRFTGLQVRLRTSPRTGIEVSIDRHSEEFDTLDQRVREYPLQASLLLYPVKAPFAPYILGGPGWYTTKVDSLSDEDAETVSTRKFGWHAGFGAELALGKHAGIHADYRYTFLKWGDDEDEESDLTSAKSRNALPGRNSLLGSVLPHHEGSMWTAGVTIYF